MHDLGFEITNFVTLNLKLRNHTDIIGYVVVRRIRCSARFQLLLFAIGYKTVEVRDSSN